MEASDVASQFQALTGYPPLPWQLRLFFEYFGRSQIPGAIDIPTGLGKTAVTALWLIAVRASLNLPRRLVYVVDRRAVVDQATAFVEDMRKRLPNGEQISISTLRGQYADNREWLDDPSRPAIVIGTVDMIGSRLLFEGYGVTRKMRPYHAGLLGADSLIVLDEAHLVTPFERLLEAIESDAASLAAKDEADRALIPRLRLLSLSATGRERQGEVFRLTEKDLGESKSITRQRLSATKNLTIIEGEAKALPRQLVDAAWALTNAGTRASRCLIYCNFREQAKEVIDELAARARQRLKTAHDLLEVKTELFIGARRGHERDIAANRLSELGFLAGSDKHQQSIRFLVATSAGEVGVDLDADHMVCDLVTWDRMIQRLGRVNRRGEGTAHIVVVDAGPFVSKAADARETQQIESAHRDVRALLAALPMIGNGHDASPGALYRLKQDANVDVRAMMERATTPVPLRPALTRALLDAWSMTSLKAHTGRPQIAPWLRGWVDEEPQTTLLWRVYLPAHSVLPDYQRDSKDPKKDIEAYFEAAPSRTSEQLQTETHRVADWLVARAKNLTKPKNPKHENRNDGGQATTKTLAPGDIAGIVLTDAGDFSRALTLHDLVDADKKQLQRDLAGKTLIVHHTVGGLTDAGTLDPKVDGSPSWLGDFDEAWTPDTRSSDESAIRWRVRLEGVEENSMEPGWRKRYVLALNRDDDGDVISSLAVYKWKQDASNEVDRAIGNSQSLVTHQSQAAKRVREIGQRLSLPPPRIHLLALAARLHDEGKQTERWQRAFNAPAQGRPFAKTTGPVNVRLLDGYRHEFGSLFYAESDSEFLSLAANEKDLVLHLIAAHHGNARPLISTRGCDQAPPLQLEARARDVALRFSRLQRRWGPWGLAWWEALLRAADQQASKDNERGES